MHNILKIFINGFLQIHNAMVYVRGGKEGFDEWAAEGCTGWDYDSVVPYFEKVEDQINILHAEKNEFINALIAACKENGIPYNEDYNLSEDQFGISSFQFLIDDNVQRETTFRSYIQLVTPPNITIRSNVLVNRALFDSNKKCIGVEFYDMAITSNVTYQVNVNKDVILSAGSIGTPQILMLSGVGPSAELTALGITVISDLPGVGSNLQDDLFVTAAFKSKQYVDPQPYGLLGAVIFWPSSLSSNKYADDISTDIESSMASGEMIGMDLPDDQKQSYWLYPNIQKLKSRGTVKLRSNSICDSTVIDPNYLANPDDVDRCIKALQEAIKIGKASAMADWYDSQLYPPPDSMNEDLQEYVLNTADTCYHYAGTAKMGPETDAMAVVSPETLEVYGVTGLRVVDASIIPTTVSGNTQGATMMIGEKASDIILTPLN